MFGFMEEFGKMKNRTERKACKFSRRNFIIYQIREKGTRTEKLWSDNFLVSFNLVGVDDLICQPISVGIAPLSPLCPDAPTPMSPANQLNM